MIMSRFEVLESERASRRIWESWPWASRLLAVRELRVGLLKAVLPLPLRLSSSLVPLLKSCGLRSPAHSIRSQMMPSLRLKTPVMVVRRDLTSSVRSSGWSGSKK
jgi:hypothetical protein